MYFYSVYTSISSSLTWFIKYFVVASCHILIYVLHIKVMNFQWYIIIDHSYDVRLICGTETAIKIQI